MGKKRSVISTIGFLLLKRPVLFSTLSFLFVSIFFFQAYNIQIVKKEKTNNKLSLSESKKKNKKTETDKEENSDKSIFN
jgi:hypothetical protein